MTALVHTSHIASVFGFRYSAFGFRLSAFGLLLAAFGFRLSASGFRLLASSVQLPLSAFGFRLSSPGSPTPYSPAHVSSRGFAIRRPRKADSMSLYSQRNSTRKIRRALVESPHTSGYASRESIRNFLRDLPVRITRKLA